MIKILYQMLSFGFVGLSATAVHTLVFFALAWGLYDPLFANFVAFFCAAPISFYGNRYLTFKARGSLPKFVLMSACGFTLNHSNVWLVTDMMSLDWRYALPGMMLAVPAFSFIISKLWVYE